MRHYGASELDEMPTLAVGQADNLKFDDGETRYWLCRCGIADGMEYENTVTVERLHVGFGWVTVSTYDGDAW